MKYLAGDIGGTKTLVAIFKEKKGELQLERQQKFVSRDYPDLESIVEIFLEGEVETPHSACFGIAGPIENGVAHATNLPWVVKAKGMEKRFKIGSVHLINDLKANAYGLQTLKEKDFYLLNKEREFPLETKGLYLQERALVRRRSSTTMASWFPVLQKGGMQTFLHEDLLRLNCLTTWQRSLVMSLLNGLYRARGSSTSTGF